MKPKTKGGLKGFSIGAVIGILLYFTIFKITSILPGTLTQKILLFISSPICMLLENTYFVGGPSYTGICAVILGLPLNIIFYGIIGMLIGIFFSKK